MNPLMSNLYGNFRTRKFTDLYDDFDAFKTDYSGIGLPTTIRYNDGASENSLKTLYYLLYARYGNSHIASSDEEQFKMKLFGIIYQYGPFWEKELDLQKEIRNLDIEDIQAGAQVRNYHGYNPTEEFSIGDDVDFVNEQNTQLIKRNIAEAYGNLEILLKKDVTNEFLNKFKPLFLAVVNPELPLWYVTEESFESEE